MRRIDRVFRRRVLNWASADVVTSWEDAPASDIFWSFVWMELADDPGAVASALRLPDRETAERLCDWYKEMGSALEDLNLELAVEKVAEGGRLSRELGLHPASDSMSTQPANVIGAVRALLTKEVEEIKERVRESAEFALSFAEIDVAVEEAMEAARAEAIGRGAERVAKWLGVNEPTIKRLRPYEKTTGEEHSRIARRVLKNARKALRDYLG